MTDSLWIEGPGLNEDSIKDLLAEIGTKTKVPINLEAIYYWIIFLPSKVHANRPVPNRYFGLFRDGSLKTRGIACCRHDIPLFIKEAQTDLLKVMGTSLDRKSLEGKLPEILDHLGDYVVRSNLNRSTALRVTSRLPAHDSGHNGAASPFMWGSFIPYSIPVYPDAFGPTPIYTIKLMFTQPSNIIEKSYELF